MDKILVLLSTYNGEKYLINQLESITRQQSVIVDILIRDDGSKDSTVELLEKYSQNTQIKYYVVSNQGAVRSFLELIKVAPLDYTYYAFCDQDDVWENDKLISAVQMMSDFSSETPILYYSGQKITDENLNVMFNHVLDKERSVFANFIFNQMAGCTAVFNRRLLQELKKYTPQNIYGHDVWCYKLCVALCGNIVIESEGHILYRQHGNNVVGLQNSILGKLKRIDDYINKYNASSYASELIKGYGGVISAEWLEYLHLICDSNTSIKAKILLLKDKKIQFHSKLLRGLFIVKTFLGKM